MTNKIRKQIIQNAIREYKTAILSEGELRYEKIAKALNMMENVFIMCSVSRVEGIDKLRWFINDAKKK